MLLPRMKLAVIFDRAFHAMADMHWRVLWILIAFHAAASRAMLGVSGETGLTDPGDFLYWYATTACTVGYGDISPESQAGRLITALWVFPGAIAGFTTVVAKVLGAIGGAWRARRAGKGDFSRMAGSILTIGYNASRTPKMIDGLCAERTSAQTLVLLTRQLLAISQGDRLFYVASSRLDPRALAA